MTTTLKLAAAILFLSAAPAPARAAPMPEDLAKAVKEYDQATTRNDVATLGRLVTGDYLLVNSDSSLQNKEQYLDDFKVPGFRLEPYVLEGPVHKIWGDAAVLAGTVRLRWTLDGKRESRRLRVVHVWQKRSGRWQITYTQLTRVPG